MKNYRRNLLLLTIFYEVANPEKNSFSCFHAYILFPLMESNRNDFVISILILIGMSKSLS